MKLNRMLLSVAALLLSGISVLSSQDFLLHQQDGVIHGFQTIEGVTESGIEVTIIRVDPSMDEELLLRIENLIGSFSIIPISSVQVTLKPDQKAELSFLTGSFQWKDSDMDEYLPSGFSIKLDGSADYDADLFIDRVFIHLEGFYKSETDFLDTVARIIDDPGSYLMSRDPEYIFHTFMSLMAENENLKQELEMLKASLREQQYNNLIMENRSLFGSIRMMDPDAVDWIVEKKESNQNISVEALQAGLLSDTGKKLDSKEIRLILGLYFGEFEGE